MKDTNMNINSVVGSIEPPMSNGLKNQDTFQKMYQYTPDTSMGLMNSVVPFVKRIMPPFELTTLWAFICRLFPIFKWLPNYQFKTSILRDIIAGITIGIIQIPQGMSFAMIGTMPPVAGLYTAFVTPAIYFFTGTFKYGIMGSSSVNNIILGKIITQQLERLRLTESVNANLHIGANGTSNSPDLELVELKMQVATASAFAIGIVLLFMGLFRLGYLAVYLSKPVMQGSMFGVTCTMLTTQIPHLLGLKVHSNFGPLSFFYDWIEIFHKISDSNVAVVIVSIVSIIFLIVSSQAMTRFLNKYLPFPVPLEIFLTVGAILCSYYLHLGDNYQVPILGHVPTGVPSVAIPKFHMIPYMITDCIVSAIFVFNVIMTQGRLFEQREGFKTDISQECIASGIANIIGSFFSSYVSTTTLIRALIVASAGAVSQVTSLVSAILLIVVLLFLAPLFEPLPHCVLSAINVVIMVSILKNILYVIKVWRISKPDAFIAIVTLVTSLVVSMESGLAVGICLSIIVVLLKSQRAPVITLGNVANTDIYIDIRKYNAAKEITGVKILHFGGPLIYANADYLRQKVCKSLEKAKQDQSPIINAEKDKTTKLERPLTLIMDFSSVNFVDSSGLETLDMIQEDCAGMQNFHLVLANCNDHVFSMMKQHLTSYKYLRVFPTIHEAVLSALTPSTEDGGKDNPELKVHI